MNRTFLLLLAFLSCGWPLPAQITSNPKHNVCAVEAGITAYRAPAIPELKHAVKYFSNQDEVGIRTFAGLGIDDTPGPYYESYFSWHDLQDTGNPFAGEALVSGLGHQRWPFVFDAF